MTVLPADCADIVWRYDNNPIIDRRPLPQTTAIYNSAVVPFEGKFVGVFRTEYKTRISYLHLGWSPDGGTMDLVDSGPRLVHAFAFDDAHGTISGGRVLIAIPEEVGAPDGLTVDAAGDVWVAIYGGGCVRRHGPDGLLRQVLEVPADQATCCAFGGPGLSRLYVTTATEGWSNEQRRADPAAGLVYGLDTDAVGRPAAPFRPDPDWWASVTKPPVPLPGLVPVDARQWFPSPGRE